ncbi:ATP-dependent DNA ligase [Gorillibacterium timonense]|uniref:ATP-dependent DNA ligase n=1 Tax=Gorillibacterium timonense TaxID=1689269 RepID=UPI000AB6A3C4|nr:RNA ligase family protein [Gorillibacterium timonense]
MLPAPVAPFEPLLASAIPEGADWIAQIKWDGVRMLTYADEKEVRLFNRRQHERTEQYPEFAELAGYCRAKSVILDGEIIALENGLPSFHQVMRRDGVRSKERMQAAMRSVPVVYMIFDLLFLEGEWVTERPLSDRQQLLAQTVIPNERVQLVPSVRQGADLFHAVCERGMEGIVCKQLASRYGVGSKDGRWVKIKNDRDLVAVVGGMTLRGATANALLLGLYDSEGRFLYIGHAGTGKLTGADWAEFTAAALPLRQAGKPFANTPDRAKDAIWLKPVFTVKIRFLDWTRHGTLRHPSIQAFVAVPPHTCTWNGSN